MDRSCYRCGAPVEEHTTFCPSCGAPQIKVTSPGSGSADPASLASLDAGTPASTPALAFPPLPVPAVQIQWRTFWRVALPLSLISGVAVGLFFSLGMVLFLASLIITIRRYARDSGGPLTASHGARLGAAMGSVAAAFFVAFAAVDLALHPAENRRQMVQMVLQRAGDPQIQQLAHWAASDQGFLVISLLALVFAVVVIVVLAGIIGAITASMSRARAR